MAESTTTGGRGHGKRAAKASRWLLALANGLIGVILVAVGVVEWFRGAAVDLESIARMGVFVGIAAMGFTQFANARRDSDVKRPRPALVAAVWAMAWAAFYLALAIV